LSVAVVLGFVGWVNGISGLNDVWSSLANIRGNGLSSVNDGTSVVVSPVSGSVHILSSDSGSIVHHVTSGVGGLRDSVLSVVEIISKPVEVLKP